MDACGGCVFDDDAVCASCAADATSSYCQYRMFAYCASAQHEDESVCQTDEAIALDGVCSDEVTACNDASHGYCDFALACREYQDGDPGSSCKDGLMLSNDHFVGTYVFRLAFVRFPPSPNVG